VGPAQHAFTPIMECTPKVRQSEMSHFAENGDAK
jgi:hypothetical protein